MEDVLDVYHLPEDPRFPTVCFDETSKQLIGEIATPLPAEPGQPQRYDYEYERNGVQNLFMFFCPLQNWRHVKVTDRRTKADWAECMRELVDDLLPDAERIRLVQDNLNTHVPAALYEVFAPAEAKRILDRLEFHYTPKHGSWLGYPLGVGGNRTERAQPAVPRAAHSGQGDVGERDNGMGTGPQRQGRNCELALYDGGRTDQAQATLPVN